MIKYIVNTFGKLWKTEGQKEIQTPKKISFQFTLIYKHLEIGFLKIQDGFWSFEYSTDFKNQNDIQPLTDFPNLDKVYRSEELTPFFMQRIPSLSQPKVMAIIEEKKIDKTNTVELLKQFGKKSITDPFHLEPAF